MQHFYTLVSQVCHCATFLFMCFPGLSLLVSALFRWPCSISIHSPNSLLSGLLNALKNGRLGAGWSGPVPGPACLPLSFVSQFFHLSPSSFHLSPSSFHFFPPRLGACGRVPGWLVSHSLSSVSHFFSLVSQFFHLSCRLGACGRRVHLSPTSFHLLVVCLWSGSRLACLPLPFILGACARVPGRLVSHFLEPTSLHLSPISFYLSPASFVSHVCHC